MVVPPGEHTVSYHKHAGAAVPHGVYCDRLDLLLHSMPPLWACSLRWGRVAGWVLSCCTVGLGICWRFDSIGCRCKTTTALERGD
jgi:hypothetical protein